MAESNTPMGGDIPEESSGHADALLNRNVWAIDVLIEEVTALFRTQVTTMQPNWLNANTVVVFSPSEGEWADMALVMLVLEDDNRIAYVRVDEQAGEITVAVVKNAILYDTRDSFDLSNAVLGLDREIMPDDLTEVAAEIASDDEGFTEGSL